MLDKIHPIYVSIVGSRLYNIHKDTSDFDIKGVGLADVDCYLGLKNVEQEEVSNGKEGAESFNGTIYELQRIMHLLFKGNPTVLEPFLADRKYIIHHTKIGEDIALFVRRYILSKHFFKPYFNYHYSQIKEFTNSNRTGKRKEEFEKYGMDCKFSAHAFRLAKQCVQLMSTGMVNPTLEGEDRDIVMKMRNHEYTKEECLAFLNNNVEEMNTAFNSSKLPETPDFDVVNDFVTDVIGGYINNCYKDQITEFDINSFKPLGDTK